MDDNHPTIIVTRPAARARQRDGQVVVWQALCDRCGDVGPTCDNRLDAASIANRHQSIGGFEK